MAFDEEAKAVQEVAKTTGQAIGAGSDAGAFIARFITGPLEVASGIVEDTLRYKRWERCNRLQIRGREFLSKVGLDHPSRKLPINFAVPLIEAASLEEDDELQDIWARLLVNSGNSDSGVEIKRAFISILQDMGSLEVRVLDAIVNAPNNNLPENGYIPTAWLPERYYIPVEGSIEPEPKDELAIALWNLNRLGCLKPILTLSGVSVRSVLPTALGTAFVAACTIK